LDALGWETAELLADLTAADARVDRATEQTRRWWEYLWGDDPVLLSVPGMGPILAPTVRAFLADGSHFNNAKAAQSFVGLNPSNWSSRQMESPSRAITKEGPPVLRLAFYQAANVARTRDPQLAEFYQRLMVERGHCHTKANCAVARKLVARTWVTIVSGTPTGYAISTARHSPAAKPPPAPPNSSCPMTSAAEPALTRRQPTAPDSPADSRDHHRDRQRLASTRPTPHDQNGVPPAGRTRLLCGQGVGGVTVVVLPFDW
jgi:hypothetical protein